LNIKRDQKLIPVSIKLPPEHIELIKSTGMQRSELIRAALDNYFGLEKKKETLIELIRNMIIEQKEIHLAESHTKTPTAATRARSFEPRVGFESGSRSESEMIGTRGIKKAYFLKDDPEAIEQIKNLYSGGEPVYKIALIVNYDRKNVAKMINKLKDAGEL